MNKKGFTLIELLIIVVFLSIIVTIAVPKITSLFEVPTSKTDENLNVIEESLKISIYNYIKRVEVNPDLKDGEYRVDDIKVELRGEKPTKGTFIIKGSKVLSGTFCIKKYDIKYENGEAKILGKCK